MTQLLIGCTGLIGTMYQHHRQFDTIVHSANVKQIVAKQFNLAICAAPSSNRLLAQQYPDLDYQNIQMLCDNLMQTQIDTMVLISSCDTQVKPDSVYGSNRLVLENFVKTHFKKYSIIRLPALIDTSIKKNVLYDLKYRQFLDKLNPNIYNQWYPLQQLPNKVDEILQQNINEINLCSEPIGNWEIIDKFASDLVPTNNQKHSMDIRYNLTPYSYSREEIFQYMSEYFQ